MSDLPGPHPGESNSRRVLQGFVAMSGSSFGVMAVQLGYAAITSRMLPPSAFGAYAVALSGVGLIGMLGGSSLGQAAARRPHDSVQLDRALVTLAFIVGGSTALVAMLLAPVWGNLWGVPDSTPVTRVLALGIPLTGLASVLAGILRRSGRTSAVAGRTAIGQLTGMAVGLAAILSMRTAWSLSVAAVAGAVVSGALLAASLPRERLRPARPTSASVDDSLYSAKSAGMNLLRQAVLTLPSWSIGRFAGAGALGAFNRSTTLVTMPLQSVQVALAFALFPEMRPGGSVSRSEGVLTDLLVLVTWPAVVIAGVAFPLAGPLLLLMLGEQWDGIQPYASTAVLLGAIPFVGSTLGTALEARGIFRVPLVAFVVGSVVIALGAGCTYWLGSGPAAMWGLVAAGLAQTGVLIRGASKGGILSARRYLAETWEIVGLQLVITAGMLALTAEIDPPLLGLACAAGLGIAEVLILLAIRRRTPAGRIATARQLPGFIV